MLKERFYYGQEHTFVEILGVMNSVSERVGLIGNYRVVGKAPRVSICGVWDTETNTMSFGVARCSSRDTFNKKVGKELARERATKSPYKIVKFTGSPRNVFESTVRDIEDEVFDMNYPIKLA